MHIFFNVYGSYESFCNCNASFFWKIQIICGNPKFPKITIGNPKFPKISIGNPKLSLRNTKFSMETQIFPRFFIGNPKLFVELEESYVKLS